MDKPITIIPPPPEEIDDEEIDALAELVASEGILCEERHDEIMESLSEWQNRLQTIETQITALTVQLAQSQNQAELPILTQLQNQQQAMHLSLEGLKAEISAALRLSNPPPSPPSNPETPAAEERGQTEESTVEPSAVARESAPPHKRKVKVI